jgi:polyhydroxyalkanoate synthesis regulator phasin
VIKVDREEVLKILKLVADGKVSPEQGRDLLEEFFEII